MGMYTKYTGNLNIASIISDEAYEKERLANFQQWYASLQPTHRAWVVDDCYLISGNNGCLNIVFGGELKNYSRDIQVMIEHLLMEYPTAEGIVTIQYEEDSCPTVLLVTGGQIAKAIVADVPFHGYGNGCGEYHASV
jgi:hypothetical protein